MRKKTKSKVNQLLFLFTIATGFYTKYKAKVDDVVSKVLGKEIHISDIPEPEKTKYQGYYNKKKSIDYKGLMPSSLGKVYHHTYYSVDYSEKHEQSNWVYYLLTDDSVKGKAKRNGDFREDPYIYSGSATLGDYRRSGYDRGHLCPAADMKLNTQAMSETFYMSNMSPQLPEFNRGEWKELEEQIRKWAIKEKSLLVVTGPVFKNNKGKVGRDNVTVPGYYYKVIYDVTPPQKMTAFILPHINRPKRFFNYQTSVNKVEEMTGIDFFDALDNVTENRLEANIKWR